MTEYTIRRNYWGSECFYEPGWQGLAEYVKHYYSAVRSDMNADAVLRQSRLTHIDRYLPIENNRHERDTNPAGAI